MKVIRSDVKSLLFYWEAVNRRINSFYLFQLLSILKIPNYNFPWFWSRNYPIIVKFYYTLYWSYCMSSKNSQQSDSISFENIEIRVTTANYDEWRADGYYFFWKCIVVNRVYSYDRMLLPFELINVEVFLKLRLFL